VCEGVTECWAGSFDAEWGACPDSQCMQLQSTAIAALCSSSWLLNRLNGASRAAADSRHFKPLRLLSASAHSLVIVTILQMDPTTIIGLLASSTNLVHASTSALQLASEFRDGEYDLRTLSNDLLLLTEAFHPGFSPSLWVGLNASCAAVKQHTSFWRNSLRSCLKMHQVL
jgi:hypothetical protein